MFQDFEPFWEFVSGPLHAGSFPQNQLDNTFGPQLIYVKARRAGPNQPPSEGLQFFGHVAIDGATQVMTVTLKDVGRPRAVVDHARAEAGVMGSPRFAGVNAIYELVGWVELLRDPTFRDGPRCWVSLRSTQPTARTQPTLICAAPAPGAGSELRSLVE